ncbi:MAG: hypothetical protein HY297_05870 [Thaumarchaeota archaeon]|nr:hypothetical protein [Nitrososphaerota archaeon]
MAENPSVGLVLLYTKSLDILRQHDWNPFPGKNGHHDIHETYLLPLVGPDSRRPGLYFVRGSEWQDWSQFWHNEVNHRCPLRPRLFLWRLVELLPVEHFMSGANPPFQVDGPPYPTDLPFYQTEALSWLLNAKKKQALAPNRFHTTEEAIEAVKQLYAAGSTLVDVVVTRIDPLKNGNDSADTLEVTFPKEKREHVLAVIRTLRPDNFDVSETAPEDVEPYTTWELWWD